MAVDPKSLCADRCEEIGQLLQERSDEIVDVWVVRRAETLAQLKQGLRDHLPAYLRKLGEDLSDPSPNCERHQSVASLHGKLRWEDGWRLDEVVADFKLLRVVLLEVLQESSLAPIGVPEIMSLSAALDEAIAASVSSYLEFSHDQLNRVNADLEERVRERSAIAEQRGEQLERLSRDLLRAEQHERKRVAGILHDHLQQLLVAARMRIMTLQGDPPMNTIREALTQIDELLQESIDASRNLTVELSPPVLTEHGLARGLEWLADWMREKYGLAVSVHVAPSAEPQDEDCRIALFHATRELLFNVVKHSGAHTAQLELGTDVTERRCTRITVVDDGRGFDPTMLSNEPRGFGLSQIRERIAMLGGRCQVHSVPGDGTRISILVPDGDGR